MLGIGSSLYAQPNKISVFVNEQEVRFNKNTGYPFLSGQATLMPLRSVVEKMGATVEWENNVARITKDHNSIEIKLDSNYIIHNNKQVASSAKAVMKDNRCYIPLRSVVIALGGNITMPDNKTIKITIDTQPIQDIKKSIATKEEAIAYLDDKFESLWQSYHLWQGPSSPTAIFRSGEEIIKVDKNSEAGRSDMAAAVAYLLSDDYNTGTLYGFYFDRNAILNAIKAATYIEKDGKFYIFDPVGQMKVDKSCKVGAFLNDITVNSLEELEGYIKADAEIAAGLVSVYAVEDGESIRFTVDTNNLLVNIDKPLAQLIYENKQIGNETFDHIKPENINKYKLPKMLGGVTLSIDEAKALVGETPEKVKDKVHTAGDLLLYMLASKTTLENGDQSQGVDGHVWHYNRTAKEVLALKKANCGSSANLANYLLEGDYEEIGFILHSYYPGSGGGHVYNYIKYKGKYYVVDFSSYLFNNYSVQSEFNFIALDQLSDYGKRWNECYGGLAAIIVHQSKGTHLPNVWEGKYYYLPQGAEFEILYETPQTGYSVGTLPMPTQLRDWEKPQ